jgi:NTP pyrophosphatase (non-canonical NTP hydrolase)
MTDKERRNMDWDKLQQEVGEWAERNFGDQAPYRQILGMIEELGELDDAMERRANASPSPSEFFESAEAVCDAMADTVIYMADFCYRTGRKLSGVANLPKPSAIYRIPTLIRHLAHHQLKLEQNIRLNEGHNNCITETLELICALLHWTCRYSFGYTTLEEEVEKTWARVQQRDWKKNPETGEA